MYEETNFSLLLVAISLVFGNRMLRQSALLFGFGRIRTSFGCDRLNVDSVEALSTLPRGFRGSNSSLSKLALEFVTLSFLLADGSVFAIL